MFKNVKINILVPLRIGSKSIKKKNIKSFLGKPLSYWCISQISKSKYVDKIIVAYDDNEIYKTLNKFKYSNKVSFFKRSKTNSKDRSTTEDLIFEIIKKENLPIQDYLMLVQSTNPFLKKNDVDGSIEELLSNRKFDSLISVVKWKRFIWNNSKPINYHINNRPLRQKMKNFYMENGSIYLSKIKNILRSKNRISGKIKLYEMDQISFVEIDENFDFNLAELLFKNSNKLRKSLDKF